MHSLYYKNQVGLEDKRVLIVGAGNTATDIAKELGRVTKQGCIKLSDEDEMFEDISEQQRKAKKTYIPSHRHNFLVNPIPYMDDLAKLIGCRPNFVKMVFKDPLLAWHCIIGPTTPYQYRLMGPGAWTGARDAILNQEERFIFLP